MSSEYKPVPVAEAARIAKDFDKSLVVITSYDRLHEKLNTTTFGVSAAEKLIAAEWGDACAERLGGQVERSTWYEDFRATEAATYKEILDALIQAAEDVGLYVGGTKYSNVLRSKLDAAIANAKAALVVDTKAAKEPA